MKPETKRTVRELFNGEVSITRDDLIVVKHGFFYRHGRTAEKHAAQDVATLAEKGLQAEVVKAEEHWNAWPRDSYFLVALKLAQVNQ